MYIYYLIIKYLKKEKMKKLMLFLAVAVLLIACGTPSTESVNSDSTVTSVDSTVVSVDTAKLDSTKLVK